MAYFQWFIGAVLVACFIASAYGQNLCDDDNGGCSHQCLYRGSGSEVECGCPCGEALDGTEITCVEEEPCDLDIYILVDVGRSTSLTGCIAMGGYSSWLVWRDSAVTIMESFLPDEASGDANIGVQTFASNLDTLANYIGSPSLSDAISSLDGMATPDCTGSSNFVSRLAEAGEFSVLFPGTFVPGGPSSLRAGSSRAAIVFNSAPSGELNNETILELRGDILLNFNQVVVITRRQDDPNDEELNLQESRLLACGDDTEPCDKVFYIDSVNDFGATLTPENLQTVINPSICTELLSESPALVVDSCDPIKMVFTIEKCSLRGMTLSDLTFNNSTCNLEDLATESDGNYVITVPFFGCGMTQNYEIDDTGSVVNKFRLCITTKFFDDYQNLVDVHLTAVCCLPTFTEPLSLAIQPEQETVSGNYSATGDYPLAMQTYGTESFSTPSYTFVVGCDVFVQALAVIPDEFSLELWSCYATPEETIIIPSQAYNLYIDGCPVDDTFEVLPAPADNSVRFMFTMFEFTSGYSKPDDQKPPVYIHCTFVVCNPLAIVQPCLPVDCDKRKRRDVSEDTTEGRTMLTQTIGPLTVESKPETIGKLETLKPKIGKAIPVAPVESPQEDVEIYAELQIAPENPPRIEIVFPKYSAWEFPILAQAMFGLIIVVLLIYVLKERRAATTTTSSCHKYNHGAGSMPEKSDNLCSCPPEYEMTI